MRRVPHTGVGTSEEAAYDHPHCHVSEDTLLLKRGLAREGSSSIVDAKGVGGDGQEEAQICYERVEGGCH